MNEIIKAIRDGRADIKVFTDLHAAWGNDFSLRPVGLLLAFKWALRSKDPILETGSGISTLVLGLAAERTGNSVISLDHDEDQTKRTQALLDESGINVVGLYHSPIDDPVPGIPHHVGFWLHDGGLEVPVRLRAIDTFADRVRYGRVMIDDAGMFLPEIEAKMVGTHRITFVPDTMGIALCVPRVLPTDKG
jgi:hypothetical protein